MHPLVSGHLRTWIALLALPLHAAVIGKSTPAEPLTTERIHRLLHKGEQAPWLDYVARSRARMAADKRALAAEREGLKEIPPPPAQDSSARSIPLHRDAAFYRSAEARHIGDTILSFQTPAGGWSKNLNMAGPARLKGQSYATANLAPVDSPAGDFDKAADEKWHYIGTLDNDATNTELHFLAELAAAFPGRDGDAYRASFLRGVEYLLQAQYPNGGWPQIWPLEGGYHDAITFNDDAVTESAALLTLASRGERVIHFTPEEERVLEEVKPVAASASAVRAAEDYSFVPAELQARAKAAAERALQCILATQLHVPAEGGRGMVLAIWAQQNDPLTLAPVAARNFEPAALATGESARVMEYLMSLPQPSPDVVRAVDAAAAWFEAHKIMGYTWSGGRGTPGGRKLAASAGAGPLWARYDSLTTGRPIFGDRDQSIHDDVMEISLERRNGYAWFGEAPRHALSEYARWRVRHSPPHPERRP
jgi:hypothetical protein